MCITKNEMLADISTNLVTYLDKEQVDMVKAVFMIKMQGYDIHAVDTAPEVQVLDIDAILQRFEKDMQAKGTKDSSIRTYKSTVNAFLKSTGAALTCITARHVTDYLADKRTEPNVHGRKNSQTYISDIYRNLSVFFDWAYRKHHINEDIMRDVDRVRPKQKKKERLSVEEMEACREAVKDDREKALLELMFSTGMRVGEISRLRIEDMNLDKRRIYIPDGKSDTSERYVYLTIKARNALKRYIGDRKTGYVFRSNRKTLDEDTPLGKGSIEKIAKDIGKRAQVHCDATVHIYRKTFASEEYRRTGSVKYVSILLGHASTAITEKYYLVDDLKDVEYQALRAV